MNVYSACAIHHLDMMVQDCRRPKLVCKPLTVVRPTTTTTTVRTLINQCNQTTAELLLLCNLPACWSLLFGHSDWLSASQAISDQVAQISRLDTVALLASFILYNSNAHIPLERSLQRGDSD